MPDGIDADRSYTQIRDDVHREFQLVRPGTDNALRFQDGKGLYLHREGQDGGLIRFWNYAARQEKFEQASEAVKESLTRQFGTVEFAGQTVNVGDFIFNRISNPRELHAKQFKEIDGLLADVMEMNAEKADHPVVAQMSGHAAQIFRQAATDYPLGRQMMTNWAKVVTGAQVMRNAVLGEVYAGLARRLGGQELQPAAEKLTGEIVDELGGAIDKGLTIENIIELTSILGRRGLGNANLRPLISTARLDVKAKAVGADLDALQRTILNADMKPDTAREIMRLASECSVAFQSLEQHLRGAGLGGQQELDEIRQRFGRSYAKAMELAGRLERGSVGDRYLAEGLREHAALTYDLALSLNWEPGVPLAARPSMNPPSLLNRVSALHSFELGNPFSTNRFPLPAPSPLFRDDGSGALSLLNQATRLYEQSVRDMRNALASFQDEPADDNLSKLYTAVENANMGSDGLMLALNRISSRHHGGMPGMRGDSVKQADREDARRLKRLVKAQRKKLRELRRLAGHLNDQRNCPAKLTDIHPVDSHWRAVRADKAMSRQSEWPTEGAPIGHVDQADPDDDMYDPAPDVAVATDNEEGDPLTTNEIGTFRTDGQDV